MNESQRQQVAVLILSLQRMHADWSPEDWEEVKYRVGRQLRWPVEPKLPCGHTVRSECGPGCA